MTHDEAIELIQAQKGGKTIEAWGGLRGWESVRNLSDLLLLIYNGVDLRIKPEPVIVRGWVNVVERIYNGLMEFNGSFPSKERAQSARYYDYTIIDTIEITYEVKQ